MARSKTRIGTGQAGGAAASEVSDPCAHGRGLLVQLPALGV